MKLAYMMSRFPLLSETFILREMIEVEKHGLEIALYPLICQERSLIHPDAKAWLPRRRCTPFFSLGVLSANFKRFLKSPIRYLAVFWHVFRGNFSSLSFLARSLAFFPKAVRVAEKIESEGITHVHAHYATYPALVTWIIHQFTGISYSITIHSHDIYDNQAMLETKLRDAAFLAPISAYNIDFMENLYGNWVREKCEVVHCGIDTTLYQPVEQKPPHTKGAPMKIIHIGTLHWKKGQAYLLEALALLRDKGMPFHCQIIGGGEERKNLEKLIADLKLGEAVEMLGSKTQEEVAALLPQADCYVQPSVSEGIPVALMEAASCALPIVATKITGIPELVISGETGLLIPPADVPALANALYTLWNNPQQAKRLGESARAWVANAFSLEKNVAHLLTMFARQERSQR